MTKFQVRRDNCRKDLLLAVPYVFLSTKFAFDNG